MKRIKTGVLPILFLFSYISLYGQTSRSFSEIIKETNQLLSEYNKINPYWGMDELQPINKTSFPKQLINTRYNGIDSISKEELISEYIKLISDHIRTLFTHKDFQKYNIEEILTSDVIYIIKSDDNKLYNITFDEKTGGTYKGMVSLMFYFEESPANKNGEKEIIGIECLQDQIFEKDGYYSIEDIQTEDGVIYILSSSVRTSTIAVSESIMTIKYSDRIFVRDFYYTVQTENLGGNLFYNSDSQTIEVKYETDYISTECNCQNIEEIDSNNKKKSIHEDDVKQKQRCYCLFEFNGTNFELTEQKHETIEE